MQNSRRVSVLCVAMTLTFLLMIVPTAWAAPPNDNFTAATVVGTLLYQDQQDTSDATMESGEPTASCSSGLSRTIWYACTPSGTKSISAYVDGIVSTSLAVYTGASLATLTQVGCKTNSSSSDTVVFQTQSGTTYYFQVGDDGAGGGTRTFHLVGAPLIGIGAATPNTVSAGGSTLLSVAVTPGTDPDSTGLSVTCDLSPIGGSATQAFSDDGTNGDATAGDNTFSYAATVAGTTAGGSKTLACTITDAQSRTGSASIGLTVITRIYDIQGSGPSAAITGLVTAEGVVVGDFEGSSGLQGFYMQDAKGDGNAATSDGIFVYTGTSNTVSLGQLVRVRGYARERFNQTTINGANSDSSPVPAANITILGDGSVIAATDVTMPFVSSDYLERFEGMLVRFSQPLVISEYYNYDRFGEIILALPLVDLEPRPFTGTAIGEPGAPALDRALANSLNRITLDDGLNAQNPATLRHPNGAPFTLYNRFRGGDTVQNTVGVLGYDFSLYRIQPTGSADYTAANPRPPVPGPIGGRLRVAAMSTLNFFLTLDYPTGDTLDNKCGPLQNVECRGADADQTQEFTRQRDKLLAAIAGLNADIVGLNELENTTGVDPLGDPTNGIVAGLKAMPGVGPYAYIDTGVIGMDVIRPGLIYKPAKVMPVGAFKLLTTAVDPRFLDDKSRPVLAQTFQEVATGLRFTVAVNHFKSKGSDCNDVGDPDLGDGQGNCNLTRTGAAQALVDWLATDPTGSGSSNFLIMGDLNSYAQEDPIDAIKAGPDDIAGTNDDYTNLISKYQGLYTYSYVFDGQAGYLDQALASSSLTPKVVGATFWHINADEPDLLDYDTTFKPDSQDALYEPNAYRSSDHDATLVGLNLSYAFAGFFPPVDNLSALNTVKAGSAVPVKFRIAGDYGLNIFAAGYPKSEKIACDTTGSMDAIEETVTAGSSGLSYDSLTDTYTYVWKTDKAWANTCRQLSVTLKDGMTYRANFRFFK